jgi:hypothetical protein
MAKGDLEEELARLKPEVDRINAFPVSEKIQLELPVGLFNLKVFNWFLSRLTGR